VRRRPGPESLLAVLATGVLGTGVALAATHDDTSSARPVSRALPLAPAPATGQSAPSTNAGKPATPAKPPARPHAPKRLPFTGPAVPLPEPTALGLLLVVAGSLLLAGPRRRTVVVASAQAAGSDDRLDVLRPGSVDVNPRIDAAMDRLRRPPGHQLA
jgi:hypothetical protein